jgi:heme-degrading monooxygenase HmoA
MFAVIFRATVKEFDEQYQHMAEAMQSLAKEKYGCLEFIACTEGDQEIAISYWETEQQILAWKKDIKHLAAQKLGQAKWYADYKVQVVEIKREYDSLNSHNLGDSNE